ncbi:carboxyl transferase domain-containing protein [Cryptosporangium phraense]|uniref:carboxyl transferase domain-containing protein n=1 Tax=Cryptosporangium phraense TaxID=2593070 RepID=UPI00197A75AE|nr:carboxyl transferase domain-containing protein [Cryptosporangium phraense]
MKLLVANRAEIAVRVLSTAATLGIPTVAVAPADDASCAHVGRADEWVELPGAGAAAYLDVDAIVDAAVRAGCDALHPGYGFLAESPVLARACAAHGITFVGPSPEDLALFGDKAAARARAVELGIPVLDGTTGPEDAHEFLASLGPGGAVMVKATAGGGGRGMRPVFRPEDLADAVDRCASEARAAFGDGSVYVERLLVDARHVEVQILGDGVDAVVLGDRDCSAQRRRQKLVEVAPAPGLAVALRAELHSAAVRLVGAYSGLATVEFLVSGGSFAFLEVNPRIQVEHTVTEEVTGLDLVELGLRVAGGSRLASLGVREPPRALGAAVQARVNTETSSFAPATGVLGVFLPPTGRGVRVDTHGYPGWVVGPRYDSLLAKVIGSGSSLPAAIARTDRALGEFVVDGVEVNVALLRALLGRPELAAGALTTTFVDDHLDELAAASVGAPAARDAAAGAGAGAAAGGGAGVGVGRGADQVAPFAGSEPVASPLVGVVVGVSVSEGDVVAGGGELVVVESMKMEHVVQAPHSGVVDAVAVKVGDTVAAGTPVVYLSPAGDAEAAAVADEAADPDRIRADLAETRERHRVGLDEARADAVGKRHAAGRRTARENLDDLLDPGSFVEYGALTIAAQRRRRSLEDLIARTPADGLITGTGTVGGLPVAVMSYDYTVLAGTQGIHNHRKTDRLFTLAAEFRLPLVMFAEGGGGRPGDTDTSAVAQLDVGTFRLMAQLRGRVPTLAIVSGYCFAGNAALAGSCDTIIATEGSSLGMGGPAMIEGGGLGVVAPGDVGPMDVQWANGVVDRVVADDEAAVAEAKQYLSYFGARPPAGGAAAAAGGAGAAGDAGAGRAGAGGDQRVLRGVVPENRLRAYRVRPVLDTLFDGGSVLELRGGFGAGMITALARLDGRPVGVLANNPEHLGGAIDAEAADKATAFLELCESHRLPVVSLCDTPGFMVGPDAERAATVRRFSAMFVAGARLTVPLVTVVLRKAYGLGAMAMAGGSLHAPLYTASWPTGEFGGMGLEGAVRLGYRKELDAIADPAARRDRYDELVAEYYERGKALSVAAVYEIDDVIDPADTRTILIRALARAE